LERKCAAALAYAELKGEVEYALRQFGKETFRLECFYETDSGKYKDVICFEAHVRPLIMEMRRGFGLDM
jgi:hypothetical protein